MGTLASKLLQCSTAHLSSNDFLETDLSARWIMFRGSITVE